MSFEQMKVSDLRKAIRHFAPETKGTGGLAHVGDKQQLIDFLQQKGVMPVEAEAVGDTEKAEIAVAKATKGKIQIPGVEF